MRQCKNRECVIMRLFAKWRSWQNMSSMLQKEWHINDFTEKYSCEIEYLNFVVISKENVSLRSEADASESLECLEEIFA